MDNQTIGKFIKELRKDKNLTQKDLADKLNITDRAVSKWERGLSCPDISLLDDLSKILDVSVLEILKGRKLNKDELINNKELVETMTFTSNNLKNKAKKITDLISLFIILFISIFLISNNIKGIYYTYKNYTTLNYIDPSVAQLKFTERIRRVQIKIELIQNNQGIYSDEEYELIKEFVNDLEHLTNKNIEKKLISKKHIKIKDVNEFYDNISIYDINGYDGNNNYKNIYKAILKYDINKYDNMLQYTNLQKIFMNTYLELSEIYYPIYKYGYDINPHIYYGNYIKSLIEIKYTSYLTILEDIIEVGEISE